MDSRCVLQSPVRIYQRLRSIRRQPIPPEILLGFGFMLAGIIATLKLGTEDYGYKNNAQPSFQGAHAFATAMFFILRPNDISINMLVQTITIACILMDASLVYYIASWSMGPLIWMYYFF